MSASTLYRRVLGSRFDDLPAVLQEFHGSIGPTRAAGELTIEHGRSFAAQLVALLWRLPAAGTLPVTLRVEPRGKTEIWQRTFGQRQLTTRQWGWRGLLIESFGTTAIGMTAVVADGEMQLTSQRFWWCGALLPGWLAPQVVAIAKPTTAGWHIDVRVTSSWIGPIFSYQGEVIPQ